MSGAAKFLTIDGRRLAYREAGSGPPLLFLHGLGGNSASWQPQFDASPVATAWSPGTCRVSANSN
jgi:pimeloyl-ACP methyl ester carboxylesterase